jgi:6,7-dimethyl-8-ribityllumazine synthase
MSERDDEHTADGDETSLEHASENVLEGWPTPPPLADPPGDPGDQPRSVEEAVVVDADELPGWSAAAIDGVESSESAGGTATTEDDEMPERLEAAEPDLEPVAAAVTPGDLAAEDDAVEDLWATAGSQHEDDAVADEPLPTDEPDAPEQEAIAVAEPRVVLVSEHAPGDLEIPPGVPVLEGEPRGARRAVGIVVSRFNGEVTTRLLDSAIAELEACGVSTASITVMPVPGAFELPLAAMALAKTRRFACVVALGCVIRGDTPHFDYVASEAASGLQLAAIETGVPVAFGVLTLDRHDQAEARYDKGAEAVRTALEMADLFANLRAAASR